MSVSARTIEQLKRGNPRNWLSEKRKQLDATNLNLHSAEGLQAIGQVQGRAAALQEIIDEFEQAGIRPGM